LKEENNRPHKKIYGEALFKCEVSKSSGCESNVENYYDLRRLDYALHNAGIEGDLLQYKIGEDNWDKTIKGT
jgi:hypothetical protein